MAPYTAIACREHSFVEKSNFEPAVGIDGNYVSETEKTVSGMQYFKQTRNAFFLWLVAWLPQERINKLEKYLQDDEDAE